MQDKMGDRLQQAVTEFWHRVESGTARQAHGGPVLSAAHLLNGLVMGLPRWPCFTILDPIRRAPELLRLKWPGLVGEVVVESMSKEPASTAALTYHAPTLAKRLETTPEALRAVIETLEGVLY